MAKVIKIFGLDIEYTPDGEELVYLRTSDGYITLEELIQELEEARNVKGKLIIQ